MKVINPVLTFDRIGRPTTGRGCVPGRCRHHIATDDAAYADRAAAALLELYGDQIENVSFQCLINKDTP